MPFHQFKRTQRIPAGLEEVWDYISSPRNLKDITPQHMRFDITSDHGDEKMYAGMIITYHVTPFPWMRLKWVTEISQVREGVYFVDVQRMGPYTFWHHQHIIEAIPGGVLMTDIVSYIPPFGFIGAIANRFIIQNRLREIFDFRFDALEKKFGKFYPPSI